MTNERTIGGAGLSSIHDLRERIATSSSTASDVASAAQIFAKELHACFSTVALARVFLVTRFRTLPTIEQAVATKFAESAGRSVPLSASTPVLSLLGTAGDLPAWCAREASVGHRAIPLIDKALVEGAPMIAALLASLNVDLAALHGDAPVQIRHLAGGLNARFYVPDARSAVDAQGRHIIAARDFVASHGIRTVFGMGGGYVDGTLAVAIMFTREILEPVQVDRFPSIISSFKMATSELAAAGALFGINMSP